MKGRINMLRDMNDVINMAERYLGVPRCSENPDETKRVAPAWQGLCDLLQLVGCGHVFGVSIAVIPRALMNVRERHGSLQGFV